MASSQAPGVLGTALAVGYAAGMAKEEIEDDIAAIERLGIVRLALRVLRKATGLRIVLVARVTEESWTAAAVLDEAGFGLKPGDELELASTY